MLASLSAALRYAPMEVELLSASVLDRVPGWHGRPRTAEPLTGGITNRNYRVAGDCEGFVVRVPAESGSLLGIDRPIERQAHRLAAPAGSGPRERALSPQPPVLCHNDLLNANFIDDGVSIRIVDWEYAGMGDRFFDFGNFAVNHQLTENDEASLLMAYFGRVAAAQHARLRLMRLMSDYREAMWGVLQQAISELDFDFAGYAGKHFDRLLAGAEDPHFRDWLGLAGA